MNLPNDPIRERINAIWVSRGNLLETMTGWDESQASFKPTPDMWSASEVLEHVYLSEFRILRRIWSMQEGANLEPELAVEHTNRNRSAEEIVAAAKDSKYISPEAVTPTGTGSFTFWMEALKANQFLVDKLSRRLRADDAKKIVFPHFAIGPLDAVQWLGFISFHMERHRLQIEYVKLSKDFPLAAGMSGISHTAPSKITAPYASR
jgi:hypothetical protein